MRIRTQRLPIGYRELEYIESTGTQHIDTGLYINKSLRMIHVGHMRENVGTQDMSLCGIRNGGDSSTTFNVWYNTYYGTSDPTARIVMAGQSTGTKHFIVLGTDFYTNNHTFDIGNGKVYFDNELILETSSETYTVTESDTLPLFALRSSGTIDSRKWRGITTQVKYYLDGNLVRNFIPAERCSDNKPGLYDIVNNVFYVNSGTGEFIKGPYKDSYQIKLSNTLPLDYTEVEYLENVGTSYIDTRLVGQSGYTLEAEVSYNEVSTGAYQYFAGFSYTGSANRVYYFRLNNSSPAYGYTYGSTNSGTTNLFTMSANTWYKCKAVMTDGNQQCWVNDVLKGTSSFSLSGVDITNPKYIYMFTSQYVSGTNGATKCKCKYARWYFNGQLVRNFIPCIRNSDNKPGMYDTVNGVFYTNQGTGEFLYGPLKTLPNIYQRVEYIESQLGYTSHINTNITLNQDSSIEIKYQFPESIDGYRARVWGASDDTAFTGTKMYAYASTNSRVDNALFGYGNENIKSSTVIYPAGTTKHHIKQIKNKLYLDDELIKTYSTQTFTSYGEAYLFQINCSSLASDNANVRIFMCKIWNNDVLVRNFIPCYRKSDNVIGLFDLINNTFYTNQGSGTFLKGKDINSVTTCRLPYVIAEGTTNLLAGKSLGFGTRWTTVTTYPTGYVAKSRVLKRVTSDPYFGAASTFLSNTSNVSYWAGKYMTLSCWYYRPSSTDPKISIGLFGNNGSTTYSRCFDLMSTTDLDVVGKWTKAVITLRVKQDMSAYSSITYIFGCSGGTSSDTLYMADPQLELKDHATPFVDGTRPDNYII